MNFNYFQLQPIKANKEEEEEEKQQEQQQHQHQQQQSVVVNTSETAKEEEHLTTKQRLEELRRTFGQENWLHSQAGNQVPIPQEYFENHFNTLQNSIKIPPNNPQRIPAWL